MCHAISPTLALLKERVCTIISAISECLLLLFPSQLEVCSAADSALNSAEMDGMEA